jgi:hypothetical protein
MGGYINTSAGFRQYELTPENKKATHENAAQAKQHCFLRLFRVFATYQEYRIMLSRSNQ